MEKAIDHLGIYDLMAVLFSGICILVLSSLIFLPFSNLSGVIESECNESLSFVIYFLTISYFIGIIFQELGSIITKKFYKKILTDSFRPSENERGVLTVEESNELEGIVSKELNFDFSSCKNKEIIIYNYCKFHLISTNSMSASNKDQSIAGLSRSLALYFFIIAISFLTCFIFFSAQKAYCFIIFLVSTALTVLFYYRYIRFIKYRYTFVFRSFYYQHTQYEKQISHNFSITRQVN